MGRTGAPFAVQRWGIQPDVILVGKGIASGYAPLGAVLVAPHVADVFQHGSGIFQHGFTYQAHPVATAAGNAVLDYIESHQLFDRVGVASEVLLGHLAVLQSHRNVGEVRGLGLLAGVEFVKDKNKREPFAKEENISQRIQQAALEENVLVYPSSGCVDGVRGDHVLLAPPFIVTGEESAIISRALASALDRIFSN
jgi:adenosylmethionine-8-amino-7-oxononanoate aminotransferase